jgi:hypothetical protein
MLDTADPIDRETDFFADVLVGLGVRGAEGMGRLFMLVDGFCA